jgi:hypothetical protein
VRKKRVQLSPGAVFAVPLDDNTFGFGQILVYEPQALDAVVCALFDHHSVMATDVPPAGKLESIVIAVRFITSDLLRSGVWELAGAAPPLDATKYIPDINQRRASGFVGTTVYGSRIASRFLCAYFRITPWNIYKDPEYFDKWMVGHRKRPHDVLWDPTKA